MNGTLSPVSPLSNNDWSPISKYQSPNGSDSPYAALPPNRAGLPTPPPSAHTSDGTSSTTDGGMSSGPYPRRKPSAGTISQSSNGQSSYDRQSRGSRKAAAMEDVLFQHHSTLKNYLAPYLRDEKGNPRTNKARDKLLRLSPVQFQELSTDVYDELRRREDDRRRGGSGSPGNDTPRYLQPKDNFHIKRNQARQKLSTLPGERFRQLATDVYYELERRYPGFAVSDLDQGRRGAASPAPSMASARSRSRGPGGPGGFRGPPSGSRGPPPQGYGRGPPPRDGPGNDYGRPLPKTFQQNTIVPNKSTMVEDDDDQSNADDDDMDDAFGLEGAAGRRSNKPLPSPAQNEVVDNLRSQLSELEAKFRQRDDANRRLESDLDRLRAEQTDMERDLRSQLEEAREASQSRGPSDGGEWRQKYENLQRDAQAQSRIIDEVRRDAAQSLQEMRALASRNSRSFEQEEAIARQNESLKTELDSWKERYATLRSNMRMLRASGRGLPSSREGMNSILNKASSVTSPDGVVLDVHVSSYQLSIETLLQTARTETESQLITDAMKDVILHVRRITSDVDAASGPSSPISGSDASPNDIRAMINGIGGYSDRGSESTSYSQLSQHGKLKAKVSKTANNLITATKNHAYAEGLSPVSLLDAAAEHLTNAVVELLRAVKVRQSSGGQYDDDGRARRYSDEYSQY